MTATTRKSRSPLALAIALALAAGTTHAATIKVTTDQDNTANDGSCTLREAIVAVNQGNAYSSGCINIGASFGSNDTIEFDSGLVAATITITGSELAISKPMTIIGTGQTIQVSGTMRAMQVVAGGSLNLSTVTISGGNTSANGAGLNVSQANASLTYVTVTGNNGGNGAGIYAYNSTLTLTECTLNGNTATGYGGGMLATHGSIVTLSSTSVYGNSANIGAGVTVSQNAQLTLSHSSLTGNAATSAGGGAAALNSSTITVSGGFVTANSAGNNGGGVYAAYSSQLTLNDLLLADNAAHYGGGAWVRSRHRRAQPLDGVRQQCGHVRERHWRLLFSTRPLPIPPSSPISAALHRPQWEGVSDSPTIAPSMSSIRRSAETLRLRAAVSCRLPFDVDLVNSTSPAMMRTAAGSRSRITLTRTWTTRFCPTITSHRPSLRIQRRDRRWQRQQSAHPTACSAPGRHWTPAPTQISTTTIISATSHCSIPSPTTVVRRRPWRRWPAVRLSTMAALHVPCPRPAIR